MRVEPSSRGMALGGSLSAVCCEHLDAFFHNPALLSASVDRMVSVSYLNHLSDLSAGFAAYSHDLGRYGTAAAGVRYLHYGSLQRTDDTGTSSGTFTASDMVLTLGAGRAYRSRFRYGINVHLAYSGIDDYSAVALLADLGAVFHDPVQQFTASASVNSAGLVLRSLGSTADEVPVDLRVSIAKRLRHLPLFVTLTAYNLNAIGSGPDAGGTASDIAAHTILGLDFQVVPAFAIRLGYNHRRHINLSSGRRPDLAGTGMGFGLRVKGFTLDYAYSSWSFAGLHQFTVGTQL